MRTSISSLFAFAALAAASTLSALTTQTITNSDWYSLSGTNLGSGGGTNPSGGISGAVTIGANTFANSVAVTDGTAPHAAGAALSSSVTAFTESVTFDGLAYITFSAQRTGSGTGNYVNLKLLQNADTNTGIVLGLGSVGSTPGLNNWGAGEGQESVTSGTTLFPNNAAIGTPSTSMTAAMSYITILIDYAAGDDDRVYIWRTDSALNLNSLNLGTAGYTQTGDYAFDRFGVYAGANSTLGFSDLTVTVPEPSTYALLFGAATLGFVGYRRFRKRQA